MPEPTGDCKQGANCAMIEKTPEKVRVMTSLFRCPICASPLEREGRTYRCPAGHSYDVSREGYVHLLPANQKHAKDPGDDKTMAAARSRFLDSGAYIPLRETLERLAVSHTGPAPAVLDAGCGEGYYTAGILTALKGAGKKPKLAGVDLSKPSLKKAARRAQDAEFAVASVYRLPLADHSVELVVNCFSPLALEEFLRVLKPGGTYLYVTPAARHLWELKEVLYDRPYLNKEESIPYEGLVYEEVVPVTAPFRAEGEVLQSLFRMTPYYWKTPKAGAQRLTALERLDITADFRVHVFHRE